MKILSSFSQVNIDWLINGTGPMLKVSNSLFPDEDLDGFGPDISQNEISEEEDMPGIKDEHLVTGLNFVKEEEEPSVNESFRKEEEYDSPAMVRSEDRVEYNRNLPPKKGKTTKVIVLYDDGTFSEYTPR